MHNGAQTHSVVPDVLKRHRQNNTQSMGSAHATFESSGFLPVRTIRTLVCAAPVDNQEAFQLRITVSCGTMHN
jgi:hypothetical protein